MGAHLRYKILPDEPRISFRYTALPAQQPSIRLLKLFPGRNGEPVDCSLTGYIWDPETGLIRPNEELIAKEDSLLSNKRREAEPSSQCQAIQIFDPKSTHKAFGDSHDPVIYEALSYTWGDEDQLYRMTINGQVFAVTRNLLEALFYLRHNTSPRALWVDAICIDQEDHVEKGNQLRQMYRIYEHANRVIVWLGIATQNSNLAFDFAEELYFCCPIETKRGDEGEVQNESGYEIPEQILEASTSHLFNADHAREWLALHKLFTRPYWGRAWVFQELVAAKEVVFVCGPKSAKWGTIELAMKFVWRTAAQIEAIINSSMPIKDQQTLSPVDENKPYHFPIAYTQWLLGVHHGRSYMKHDYSYSHPSSTTERFLELISTRMCTYQHDKVYSLLGILPLTVSKLIPDPNYKQPAKEVYKQAVKAYVLGSMSLNIICYSHHTDTQDDLPSWALDLRRKKRLHSIHNIAGVIGTSSQLSWHSSALSRYPPHFSADLSTLSVHGIRLGTVRYTKLEDELLGNLTKIPRVIQDIDGYGNPTCHHRDHFLEWWSFEEDAKTILVSGTANSVTVLEDEVSTLLGMLLFKRDRARFASYTSKSNRPRSKKRLGDLDFEGVYSYLRSSTKCRTVAETDTLEFVLAPYWAQPGDFICQFIGCSAAAVLREQEGGNYKFIGDCYVLGKMGQAAI